MADKDLVEELESLRDDGVINATEQVRANAVLSRAIAEILRLRSLAGAVSVGSGDFRSVKTLLPHAGTSFADPFAAKPVRRPEGAEMRHAYDDAVDDKPNTGC